MFTVPTFSRCRSAINVVIALGLLAVPVLAGSPRALGAESKTFRLALPADFSPARRTILLVPGLESVLHDTDPFATACRATGIQLVVFQYPNDGPLRPAAIELKSRLHELLTSQPKFRPVLLGFSMGGLIAREVIETEPGISRRVSDLFLLGVPNQGSRLAAQQPLLELAVQVLPHGTTGLLDSWRDGAGEAALDLTPGSPFLTDLSARRKPQGVRYHCAIGTRSYLSQAELVRLRAEISAVVRRRQTPETVRLAINELLASGELIDGQADGAVTIASARLADASEQTFPVRHHELLSLPGPRPEKSEIFQWLLAELGWRGHQ